MKSKKSLAILLAVILCAAAVFTGCTGGGGQDSSGPDSSSAGQSSGGSEKETLNIAYFGPHQDNEYQIGLREAVEAAGKAKSVNVKVYIADNDPAKQISQIEQAIAEGVDGILIDPVSFDGIATAVTAAKTAKIPFVTVHESVSSQDDCTAFVGSNLRAGGKLKMEQVMKDFPDGADLGILYGPLGQTAQIDITDGYQDALKEAGKEDKYKTVFDGEANWNSEDALELVSNWLSTGKNIDALVCNNDGMAIGALQAVKSAGKTGEIKIYGLDAQQDVLKEVKAGNIQATIFNDFNGEASTGMDLLIKAIGGETVEKETLIEPKVVTKENVDEYIK